MFGYHGDTGHSAEVETILHSRCPAQVTFSVTMQSHGDTSVDITGGDIGRWHIEILAYNVVEGLIGILVGVVGASVSESPKLLFTDGIFQQR